MRSSTFNGFIFNSMIFNGPEAVVPLGKGKGTGGLTVKIDLIHISKEVDANEFLRKLTRVLQQQGLLAA